MSLICYKSRLGKQAVPSTFRCREGDTSLKDLKSTLHAPVKLHVGAALSLTSFPRHRELKYPTVHRTCAPRRRQRAKAEVALERHPAARGAACRRVLPGSWIAAPPLPPSPFLSGCTRPNPTTETTKWLPAASSRDPFVPFGFPNSVGPGYKWPGSAGGLSGDPAGPWRLGVEAGGGGVKGRPATESRRRREDGGHFVWVCCSAAAAGSRGSGAWRWVGQGS